MDRLWPRGMTKEALGLEAWVQAAAPSDALRRWYGHDPKKWEECRRRYRAELDANPEAWQSILAPPPTWDSWQGMIRHIACLGCCFVAGRVPVRDGG